VTLIAFSGSGVVMDPRLRGDDSRGKVQTKRAALKAAL
jgi:hypothetical protein